MSGDWPQAVQHQSPYWMQHVFQNVWIPNFHKFPPFELRFFFASQRWRKAGHLHSFFEGAFHVAGNNFVQSFEDFKRIFKAITGLKSILVWRQVLKWVKFIAFAAGRIHAWELIWACQNRCHRGWFNDMMGQRNHSSFFLCILQPLKLEAGTRRIVARRDASGMCPWLIFIARFCSLFLHFFRVIFVGAFRGFVQAGERRQRPRFWPRDSDKTIEALQRTFFWGVGLVIIRSNALIWYSCQMCYVDISSHFSWRDKTIKTYQDFILEGRQAFPGLHTPWVLHTWISASL